MHNPDPANTKEHTEIALFYQDHYPWIVGCLVLLVALLLLLVQFNLFLSSDLAATPVFFKSTDDGALVSDQPLNISNQPENKLLNGVADSIMRMNTFNFVNYEAIVQGASLFFLPEGYEEYKKSFQTFKIIDKVLAKKMVLLTTPLDAPHVVLEKVFANRYMWKIQIPVQFKYQNVDSESTDRYQITLVVTRVPITESPEGVLILKYDMQEISRFTEVRLRTAQVLSQSACHRLW